MNISRFLSDIAFSQKGLVYTIGDGYFIKKLVYKSVFKSVGILKGVHSTELLHSLAVNAFQEKTLQGLVAGSPLTSNQIKALTLSIIWPVWRDNCLENEKCLNFKLYFNDVTLKQNLSGAIIYTENGMDMKVSGDVHIGVHGKIISKGPIKFEVQGNWENLGMVDSEIAVNIIAKNIVKVDRTTLEKEDL